MFKKFVYLHILSFFLVFDHVYHIHWFYPFHSFERSEWLRHILCSF